MSIDVANESGAEVAEVDIGVLARYVLDRMRVHPLAELSIVLVDEQTMSDLHEQWMDEPGPTDVLAFPMDELRPGPATRDEDEEPESGMLGDVVLCPEVARVQGERAGHGRDAELELLCTHGILHLLGYDHAEQDERREMFGLQDELLASWRRRPTGP